MQIFYLETNEEVPSIIDRIQKSDESEIALVVPKGAQLLQSIVNLKLIKRETEKSKKNILIVTTDKIGRNLASQIGLTVYEKIERGKATGKVEAITERNESGSVDEILTSGIKVHRYGTDQPIDRASETVDTSTVLVKESDEIKLGGRSTKRKNLKMPKFLVKFGLIAIVVIIIAAIGFGFWALPITNITVTVKAKTVNSEKEALTSADGTGGIKSTLINSEKTSTSTVAATGKKDIGEKAKGKVTIYNEYSSSAQPLQAGTRMQTADGKVYRLDSDVVVPGGEFEVEGSTAKLTKAGTTSTDASADQPGDSYNIGDTRLTIPGIGSSRQDKIYAKTSGFVGGISKTVKVVSASDISDAEIDLTNRLTAEAQEEIKNKTAGQTVIQESVQSKTLSFATTKKAGEEAENFDATLKMEMKALSYNTDELKTYLTQTASQELTKNEVFILTDDSLKITVLEFNLDENKAKFGIKYTGKVTAKTDQNKIRQDISGKSIPQAQSIIKQIDQFGSVKIDASPSWWFSRIPKREKSLKLDIKYE